MSIEHSVPLPGGEASDAAFTTATEPYRRELLAHCYRLTGSLHDAEDLVQETYLRAWRGFGDFEGRASVRTWLHRIATNACLTALQHRSRRILPSGLGPASDDPYAEPPDVPAGVRWLEPVPDVMVRSDVADPAAVVEARDDLRLALIASLQYLPPRQRAVLLLRDVLGFHAAEVAGMLGMTTTAVKSALARARARLEEVSPSPDTLDEPSDAEVRRLLERFLAAFEQADAAMFESVLRDDVVIEAHTGVWFQGKATCMPFIRERALAHPELIRLVPVRANGQPAIVVYGHEDATQPFFALGVAVLTVTSTGIARLTIFGGEGTATRFGLPETM